MTRHEIWVWIRVPLGAVERAIGLLKDAAMRGHNHMRRSDEDTPEGRGRADQDERYAEDFKKAVRDEEEPPAGKGSNDNTHP